MEGGVRSGRGNYKSPSLGGSEHSRPEQRAGKWELCAAITKGKGIFACFSLGFNVAGGGVGLPAFFSAGF